jgi:hypothetical protein
MSEASPECNGGLHGLCPGYYKMTHMCRCTCHKPMGGECKMWHRCHLTPSLSRFSRLTSR